MSLMWSLLNRTPILEWYMARLIVENEHQKDIVMMSLDYVLRI